MYKFNFKDLNSKWIFLILLVITVSIITYFRVKLQADLGAILDTYDYLSDAAEFAGKGFGFNDFNRPPLLSLITSIFFVFGGLSVEPIMIVDGILYILGCIGLYLFLKHFFTPSTSFIGSMLFATFPIVITYMGAGFNDVSSVSVAIWAIYLTYLGVKKDSKYLLASFSVAMLAFLTRYNMALLIFPIFFYILINRKEIKKPRNLFIGIIIALLVTIPLLYFFNLKFGNPIYPFLDFFKTSSGAGSTEHFAYNPDPLYFVKNTPLYIGAASFLVIFLTMLAVVVNQFKKYKAGLMENKSLSHLKNLFKNPKFDMMLILLVIFMVSFSKIHYMLSELIFFAISCLAYLVTKDYSLDVDVDLLFLVWFMAFFIFQSVYVAKDHRYFIGMIVPVAYFLAKGFNWSLKVLKFKFKDLNLTLYVLSILLLFVMILSVSTQLADIEKDNENSKLFNQDAQAASYWLMKYDPNYKSKVIYADLWSYYGWYLKTNVGKMPVFRNNQTLYVGTKDYNFTSEDRLAFNNELEKVKPDYYMCAWNGMNFTSYQPIAKFGTVTIYRRI